MASKCSQIVLCLIKCGQTTWQRDHRLHGSTGLPMSDAGRAAINAEASRLAGASPSTIHHPPDEAATETAQIIAQEVGTKLKVNDDLADPDLGLLEGMLEQRFAEQHPKRYKQWEGDPLSFVPPEGEPFADARARIFLTLGKLLKKSRAAELGIVLHPIGFGLLRCWLAEKPSSDLMKMIESGRRVERYAMAPGVLERLVETARAELAGS